jgi:lipoprotein signal peptidase
MTARGPDIRDGRPDLRPIAIASGVVILDATTKMLAGALVSRGLASAFVVPTQNADFSLGVASAPFPIMLALAGLGILCFGGYTAFQALRGNSPGWVPALIIGGAVANLLDRLLFGAVHDWLYLPRVTINLADVAVVVGVMGYLVSRALEGQGRRQSPSGFSLLDKPKQSC